MQSTSRLVNTHIERHGITNISNGMNDCGDKPTNYESSSNDEKVDLLHADGRWFKDNQGRVVILRGVNLSGSTKLPYKPYIPSHESKEFFNHRNISFVGRPFPLNEADEHFARLQGWGFTFLRFLITWEAIEHAGPRIYDTEYFDYVAQILLKARKWGFKCFIDPHQDVWSRFTGGSGAPGWTLELVGFDMTKFAHTYSALVHNTYDDPDNFPRMIWPTNYYKLACATMFTIFFGGKTFAPKCLVEMNEDGSDRMYIAESSSAMKESHLNIQDYLQDHYCNAVKALVQHVSKIEGILDCIITGYDTLNEPSCGYIGWESLSHLSKHQELKFGYCPTALEGMLLGQGIPCKVQKWSLGKLGPQLDTITYLDPNGISCWKEGYQCIWEAHGLYDSSTKTCLNIDYFHRNPITGEIIDFKTDFWRPFVRKYSETVRSVHSQSIIFIEPPVNEIPPFWRPEEGDPAHRICYAPHWYDGLTLMNKHFSTWWTIDYIGYMRGRYNNILSAISFGLKGIKKSFTDQIINIRNDGLAYIGETPFIIGEIGIPFDMDGKKSYRQDGSFDKQVLAMDANISALEKNICNYTLWNYCSDNSHKYGDNWNGEDLSIFSRDSNPEYGYQEHAVNLYDIIKDYIEREPIPTFFGNSFDDERKKPELDYNIGGRAISAFVRPSPLKVNGIPEFVSFDLHGNHKNFIFRFRPFSSYCMRILGIGTEIFIPNWHFGLPIARYLHANGISVDSTFYEHCDELSVNLHDPSSFFDVKISSGSWSYDEDTQILHWFHGDHVKEKIELAEIEVKVLSRNEIIRKLDKNMDDSSFCYIL